MVVAKMSEISLNHKLHSFLYLNEKPREKQTLTHVYTIYCMHTPNKTHHQIESYHQTNSKKITQTQCCNHGHRAYQSVAVNCAHRKIIPPLIRSYHFHHVHQHHSCM